MSFEKSAFPLVNADGERYALLFPLPAGKDVPREHADMVRLVASARDAGNERAIEGDADTGAVRLYRNRILDEANAGKILGEFRTPERAEKHAALFTEPQKIGWARRAVGRTLVEIESREEDLLNADQGRAATQGQFPLRLQAAFSRSAQLHADRPLSARHPNGLRIGHGITNNAQADRLQQASAEDLQALMATTERNYISQRASLLVAETLHVKPGTVQKFDRAADELQIGAAMIALIAKRRGVPLEPKSHEEVQAQARKTAIDVLGQFVASKDPEAFGSQPYAHDVVPGETIEFIRFTASLSAEEKQASIARTAAFTAERDRIAAPIKTHFRTISEETSLKAAAVIEAVHECRPAPAIEGLPGVGIMVSAAAEALHKKAPYLWRGAMRPTMPTTASNYLNVTPKGRDRAAAMHFRTAVERTIDLHDAGQIEIRDPAQGAAMIVGMIVTMARAEKVCMAIEENDLYFRTGLTSVENDAVTLAKKDATLAQDYAAVAGGDFRSVSLHNAPDFMKDILSDGEAGQAAIVESRRIAEKMVMAQEARRTAGSDLTASTVQSAISSQARAAHIKTMDDEGR